MMSTKAPTMISSWRLGEHSACAIFSGATVLVNVKSVFSCDNARTAEDLFFDIISMKLTNGASSMLYCKDSQFTECVPQKGGI